MKTSLLWTGIAVFSAGLSLVTPSLMAQNAEVVVHDAWVRLPAPMQKDAALYFSIENHSSLQKTIMSASSDQAEKVEMHEEKMDPAKKMMSMTPVKQIVIPAGGKATLDPGGLHMMLYAVKSKLSAGSMVPVTIKLDDGTTVAIMAAVREQGDGSKDSTMKMKK